MFLSNIQIHNGRWWLNLLAGITVIPKIGTESPHIGINSAEKTVLIIGLHNWFATLLSHLAKASGTQGTVLDDSSRASLNLKKNDNVEDGETP